MKSWFIEHMKLMKFPVNYGKLPLDVPILFLYILCINEIKNSKLLTLLVLWVFNLILTD